jgi:formylglycine-generating enzyme required for sulfatase activity
VIGSGLTLAACGRVSLGTRNMVEEGLGGSGSDSRVGEPGVENAPGVFGADDAPVPAMEMPVDAALADPTSSAPNEQPSCRREQPRCGLDQDDCCAALSVPAGTFAFTADSLGTLVMVTLSSHRLERFEVTVGRAREFIANYDDWRASGEPTPGLGGHPRIADSGWRDAFTAELPATGAALADRWASCALSEFGTFAAEADGRASARVPLNCATWYEAFAFCAWDGGRLPTLAELQYSATGGAEGRTYPWGDAPPPNLERASFGCGGSVVDRPECLAAPSVEVGRHPLGRGRFGQDDLAGSMAEWALDGAPTITESCSDCASLIDGSVRTLRGGSWFEGPESLAAGAFVIMEPYVVAPFGGVRCARDQ